nr:hypothetical protein Iba_chr09dCG4610 [Ipomoea batatas]GMD36916.1 hypothetical protein Iba_chr09eCG4440 [Ipomoea batatas]
MRPWRIHSHAFEIWWLMNMSGSTLDWTAYNTSSVVGQISLK